MSLDRGMYAQTTCPRLLPQKQKARNSTSYKTDYQKIWQKCKILLCRFEQLQRYELLEFVIYQTSTENSRIFQYIKLTRKILKYATNFIPAAASIGEESN